MPVLKLRSRDALGNKYPYEIPGIKMSQFVIISKWKSIMPTSPGWLGIEHINILAENVGVLRSLVPGATGTDEEVGAIFQDLVIKHYASAASLLNEGKMAGYHRVERLPDFVITMMMFNDEADFVTHSVNDTWIEYSAARDKALAALGVTLFMKKFSIVDGSPASWDQLHKMNADGLSDFYDSLEAPEEIRPATE
jgi:hypothetical protein